MDAVKRTSPVYGYSDENQELRARSPEATKLELDSESQSRLESADKEVRCFHGFDVKKAAETQPIFTLVKEIGSGAFSNVYQAKCVFGCSVAIKEFKKNNKAKEKQELEVLLEIKKARNHNIIDFFGSYQLDGKSYFVFEIGDEPLDRFLYWGSGKAKNMGLNHFNNIAQQLLEMIFYLNENDIYHKDFKEANMVYFF